MDDLLRMGIRQIALGGLRGITITDLWHAITDEQQYSTEGDSLPFQINLDVYVKAAIWRELLKCTHVEHFTTKKALPKSPPLLDLNTLVFQNAPAG